MSASLEGVEFRLPRAQRRRSHGCHNTLGRRRRPMPNSWRSRPGRRSLRRRSHRSNTKERSHRPARCHPLSSRVSPRPCTPLVGQRPGLPWPSTPGPAWSPVTRRHVLVARATRRSPQASRARLYQAIETNDGQDDGAMAAGNVGAVALATTKAPEARRYESILTPKAFSAPATVVVAPSTRSSPSSGATFRPASRSCAPTLATVAPLARTSGRTGPWPGSGGRAGKRGRRAPS